jgi:hypothetical protein
MFKSIIKSIKKAAPIIGGAVGGYFLGPMGASLGAGLGTAAQGGSASEIATNAMLGYGIGSLGSMGLKGAGMSFGKLGAQGAIQGIGSVGTQAMLSGPPSLNAVTPIQNATANTPSFLSGVGKFAKDNKLLTGALGLGALGALGSMEEDEDESTMTAPPTAGSRGSLNTDPAQVTYYDKTLGRYGAASPTLADGGDVNFPRKEKLVEGPGTEKSDDIPAMLSDGEFVMTSAAVRGLGTLNGAQKDDKLEQRRKGAQLMQDMMKKFEKRAVA